jgi:exopolysaccharide biosynthesis protein
LHQVPPAPSEQWRDAASGVHSLVTAGAPRTAADDTLCGSFCTTTHPRSAIGLDRTGRWMVWVAAEGRQKSVTGLPLAKLAELMRLQGVSDAVNFDGGGSTALHIEAKARTQRPDNEPEPRKIANAWVISSTPDPDWKALCPSPKQEPR